MNDGASLRVERIGKAFAGVQALADVSFSTRRGEVHAVMGENGAGKSTLMKIIAGVYPFGSFQGTVSIEGSECRFDNVLDAEAAGIVMIPQELAVVGELSVAENMFLNAWPSRRGLVDWDSLYDLTRANLDRLGITVGFDTPMKLLSAAQQQMVLIAKALSKNVRVLVLDEPTSSLSAVEAERLFERLSQLRREGVTALYISHKIDEVMAISDSVTVLRDGMWVGTRPTSELEPADIVAMMVGRSIAQMYPRVEREPQESALSIEGLRTYRERVDDEPVLKNISFEARRGEILGIYGLMGSGRTELLTALFGAWNGPIRFDRFEIAGKPAVPRSPRVMMDLGVGLLTEDRKRSGIVPGKDIQFNLTLASLAKISAGSRLNPDLEREQTQRYVQELAVRTPTLDTAIDNLSGGNQQKVLLGRWLSADAQILLLDDPTRGVDVGAKVEIFHLLNELAGSGVAIVFVSSELPEVLGIADRILVMHEGELAAEFDWRDASEERVMEHAAGQRPPIAAHA